MNRRSFCRTLGLTGLAAVAGCVSSGDDPAGSGGGPSGNGSTPDADGSPPDVADASGREGSPATAGGSGEWPSFGVDRHNAGVHPDATGPTAGEIRWKAIGDAPTVLCSPVVSGGTVYTGSAARAVHALDPATGEELWRYDTDSYVETAPAVVGDTLYTADADGVVYALGTDGSERWTHETNQNLHSRAVAVHDGRVFVGTGGTMPAVASGETTETRRSHLLAFDAATGEKLWSYDGTDWFSGPAVGGGRVYAGDHTGRVSAVDPASGDRIWTWRPDVEAGDDPDPPGAVLAPPTYRDGTLYVGVHELGWLVALDAATGDHRWHQSLKAANVKSSPAVDGDRVYVAAQGSESTDYDGPDEPTPTETATATTTPDDCVQGGGTVTATATGTETDPGDCDRPVEMPTYDPSGSVFALSTADGAIEWRTETDHDFRSSPAVAGDRVYVGGGDYLYSLARSDGGTQWRVEFGDFVYSSPAVVGGRAYVGSADGYLYCVGGE